MANIIDDRQETSMVTQGSGRADNRPGFLQMISAVLLVVIVVLLAILLVQNTRHNEPVSIPSFTTPYQAVLLNNGMAYFGKVESRGPRFLVLTDVYYVQTRVTPDAKGQQSQSNVLIKRGVEWHAPDRMAINVDHIIFMEPVTPSSKLAGLIQQSQK